MRSAKATKRRKAIGVGSITATMVRVPAVSPPTAPLASAVNAPVASPLGQAAATVARNLARKRTYYEKHRIPQAAKKQIAGFTEQAWIAAYQASIRNLKQYYGYDDGPVTLRNTSVLEKIAADADVAAQQIIDGYNTRLSWTLARMDDGASDDDYLENIDGFQESVAAYNTEELLPRQKAVVRQSAILDFVNRNGITTTWVVDPLESESPPNERCQVAITVSGDKGALLTYYDAIVPGSDHKPWRGFDHNNCPHALVIGDQDMDSLPSENDLWDGSDEEYDYVPGEKALAIRHMKATEALGYAAMLGLGVRRVQKFNQNHAPAGSPEGGQFTAGSGGGLSGSSPPSYQDDRARRVAFGNAVMDKLPKGEELKSLRDDMMKLEEDGGHESSYGTAMTLISGEPSPADQIIPITAAEVTAASNGKVSLEDATRFISDFRSGALLPYTVALVQAAGEKFGIDPNEVQSARVSAAQERIANHMSYAHNLAGEMVLLDHYPIDEARAFVDAQYAVTQKYFADHGITSVDLYRGVTWPQEKADAANPELTTGEWQPVTVAGRAVTGWSADFIPARNFANAGPASFDNQNYRGARGYILHAAIPAKDVLGTAFTGIGSGYEGEYAVIGHPHAAQAIQHSPNLWMRPVDAQKLFHSKFNQNHDEKGRFASSDGAGALPQGPITRDQLSFVTGLPPAYLATLHIAESDEVRGNLLRSIAATGTKVGYSPPPPINSTAVSVAALPPVTPLIDSSDTWRDQTREEHAYESLMPEDARQNPHDSTMLAVSGLKSGVLDELHVKGADLRFNTMAEVQTAADGWNWVGDEAMAGYRYALLESASERFGVPIEGSTATSLAEMKSRYMPEEWAANRKLADAILTVSSKQTATFYATTPNASTNGSVALYRGMYVTPDRISELPAEVQGMKRNEEREITMGQAPIRSWTKSHGIAMGFANNDYGVRGGERGAQGYVISANVPVPRIVGNGIVGLGVAGGEEHVVVGGPMRVTIKRMK